MRALFFSALIAIFCPIAKTEGVGFSNEKQESDLIAHVKWSIEQGWLESSKLQQDILDIQGMSSRKVRHFLNNLCSFPKSSYLEIGCWKGSTLLSALYGNNLDAIGVDDWSQLFYGDPNQKKEFYQNASSYLLNGNLIFLESDCFKLDCSQVFRRPVNIYFYDGNHSFESQRKAFVYFNSVLDNLFVAVVDDWNWGNVQGGTKAAFQELGYHVLFEAELPARYNQDTEFWWNGLYVAVIRK